MQYFKTTGRRLWNAYLGFQEHDGTVSASAIAYCVAVAFFPLMIVLMAGLGWVLRWTTAGQDAKQQLLATLRHQVSPELADQVGSMLQLVGDKAGTSGPIGFVVLVISAIVIFAQLDAAFDRIFKQPSNPHETWARWVWRMVHQRLKALGMLIGVGGFILLTMIGSTVLASMQQVVDLAMQWGPWIEWATSLWINLVLNVIAFMILYQVVPKVYVRWREALHGAILAAILWELGRQALTSYFSRLNYPTAYGVIGSFLVVMLWAYYGSMVILYGAEYVRATREDVVRASRFAPS